MRKKLCESMYLWIWAVSAFRKLPDNVQMHISTKAYRKKRASFVSELKNNQKSLFCAFLSIPLPENRGDAGRNSGIRSRILSGGNSL